MKVYLNWRGPCGRETVDEFEQELGQSRKDFRKYVLQMQSEYSLAGMETYQSSRFCANWKVEG